MTELVGQVDTFAKKPLGGFTAHDVFRAFADFDIHSRRRGGHIRVNKDPHNPSSSNVRVGLLFLNETQKTSEDLHVESSFTEEQEYYVRLAFVCLISQAQGKSFGINRSPETFSDQIKKRYVNGKMPDFGFVVESSICEMVGKFMKDQPAFVPAMDKVMQWAGYGGFIQSIRFSAGLLDDAVNKQFSDEDMKTYGGAPKRDFIGLHPSHEPDRTVIANTEIWCLGETLGRAIIEQSALAALTLSEESRFKNVRGQFFLPVEEYDKNLRRKIGAGIVKRMKELGLANTF